MLKKIMLTSSIVILVSFVLFVYDQFNGNPISKYRAANALENYLENEYPELEWRADNGFYDFKFNEYSFIVTEIGSGTVEAEEVGSESSEKLPEPRNYHFTVHGVLQPEVRMDGIRFSRIDSEMTERISEEAAVEIKEHLGARLSNLYAVDVRAEVLTGQLEGNVTWNKNLPIDRPITVFIVLDSADDTADDFYRDAVTIQELLDGANYNYERVTINGNVISFEGLENAEDKYEHRGYVKFGLGFDKGEELKQKNIRQF